MSAQKRKGTSWESAIVTWLHEAGVPHAERRALNGARDRGDIAGIPGVCLEAKAAKTLRLGDWMSELADEIYNDGADTGALWIKRHGRSSAGEGYIVLDPGDYLDLLRDAGYLPPPTPVQEGGDTP